MSAFDGLAPYVSRPRAPQVERRLVMRDAAGPPQRQCWTADLLSRLAVSVVDCDVGRLPRPIVFAARTDAQWVGERSAVMREGAVVESAPVAALPGRGDEIEVIVRAFPEQQFGQRRRLRQELPVPYAHRELRIHQPPHVPGRNNVEDRKLVDAARMIE